MKQIFCKQTHTAGWFGVKKLSLSLVLLLCVSISIQAQRVINLNDESAAIRAASSNVIPQEFLAEAKAARAFAINPALQRAEHVEVGDIVNLQLFEGSNYKAEVVRTTNDANGNFTLTLSFPDCPFAFAIITTDTAGRSLVNVSIPTLGQRYGSRYSINGTRYLIEVDKNKIEVPRCGTCSGCCTVLAPQELEIYEDDISSRLTRNIRALDCNGPPIGDNPYAPATIDMLIVFTPAAETHTTTNQLGGIDNLISAMIAENNVVFSNSQTGITIEFTQARVDFTEPYPFHSVATLHRLRDPNDVYMGDVHIWRRDNEADLVQILTAEDDMGGWGFLPNASTIARADLGFSLVSVRWAVGHFISAHEIGHNMGLGHSTQQTSGLAQGMFTYSHGWRFQASTDNPWGNRWRNTVMAYQGGQFYANGLTSLPVPFFSNPNLNYPLGGAVMGDARYADAARSLREVKHIVASHSDRLAMALPAPTNIVVSNPRENGATFSWDAVEGALGYRVYISNGTTIRSWWSTTNSITITDTSATPLLTACNTFEVWLEAINECWFDGILSRRVTFRTFCPATDPVVTTLPAADITTTTAALSKTVIPASGHPVISQGFRYRAVGSSDWVTSETGVLTGLTRNTQYQFHAFAVTNLGTFNGSILTFVTYACEDADRVVYIVEAMSGWADPGWFGGAELRVRQGGVQVQAVAAYRWAPPSNPVIVPVPLCPCKDIDFVWINGWGNEGKSFAIRDNLGNVIFATPPHAPHGDPNAGAGAFANNQVVFSTTSPARISPLTSFGINAATAENIVRHTCDNPRGEIVFDDAFVVTGNADIFFTLASEDYVLYLNGEQLEKTDSSANFNFGETSGSWTGVLQVLRASVLRQTRENGDVVSDNNVVATYDISLTVEGGISTDINEIPVNREVQSVQCYTVTGIRIDCNRAPQGSVIIKRTVYTDGSVEIETKINAVCC